MGYRVTRRARGDEKAMANFAFEFNLSSLFARTASRNSPRGDYSLFPEGWGGGSAADCKGCLCLKGRMNEMTVAER